MIEYDKTVTGEDTNYRGKLYSSFILRRAMDIVSLFDDVLVEEDICIPEEWDSDCLEGLQDSLYWDLVFDVEEILYDVCDRYMSVGDSVFKKAMRDLKKKI